MRGVFVNDGWYVAAWSDEVTEASLARTLLGREVVLRRHGAAITAVEAGRRSCPVIEQHRCVWVWMGDVARADPATIRDFGWLTRDDWSCVRIHRRIACHYLVVIDNLLDLSHRAEGPDGATADDAPVQAVQTQTDRLPDGVRVSRWACDVPPTTLQRELGGHQGRVDQWHVAEFRAPGSVVVDIGAATAGTGAADGRTGAARSSFVACHGITPETERTTHSFWALAHDFATDSPHGTTAFQTARCAAMEHEIALFEAQQRVIDLDPEAPTTAISYDAGPLQARRLLERLIASQQAGARGLAEA